MTRTYLVLTLALVACGSKDDKGKGGDKGGGGGGGAANAEGQIMLKKITSAVKETVNTEGSFPIGKVGPTPAEPCCKRDGKKCKPDAALWSDPAWRALGFSIDEPFAFQYSYEGTAKSFTAKAIGCDGAKTFTASGAIDSGGAPRIDFTEQ